MNVVPHVGWGPRGRGEREARGGREDGRARSRREGGVRERGGKERD